MVMHDFRSHTRVDLLIGFRGRSSPDPERLQHVKGRRLKQSDILLTEQLTAEVLASDHSIPKLNTFRKDLA